MGTLKIHFTLDGVSILEPGYSSAHPLFGKPESLKAVHFAQRNAVEEMRQVTFEGDDVTIELDAAHLPEKIDWNNLNYPSEQIKSIVLDVLYRIGVKDSLYKIKRRLSEASSVYELERITEEAIRIILAIKPKPEEEFYEHNKNDVVGSLRYTLSKEVSSAKSANKRDKDKGFNSAQSRLISDLQLFNP